VHPHLSYIQAHVLPYTIPKQSKELSRTSPVIIVLLAVITRTEYAPGKVHGTLIKLNVTGMCA